MNVANCIEEILKLHPYRYMVFSMMYPIMVKIDFGEVVKAGKSGKPVFLTPGHLKDRRALAYQDGVEFLPGILSCLIVEIALLRKPNRLHYRSIEPFRSGHRHLDHALRPVIRCGSGHGDGCSHRSAGYAHEGQDRFKK